MVVSLLLFFPSSAARGSEDSVQLRYPDEGYRPVTYIDDFTAVGSPDDTIGIQEAIRSTSGAYQITLRPKPRADGLNWLVFNGLGEFVCSRSSLLAARRKIAENNPIW